MREFDTLPQRRGRGGRRTKCGRLVSPDRLWRRVQETMAQNGEFSFGCLCHWSTAAASEGEGEK